MSVVKYHLPGLKVRQNEVVRFRKSACPLLSCALIKANLPDTLPEEKKSTLKGEKKNTLTSLKFLCISTDCYSVFNLALRRLICFRFVRRDVVTTQSVCGHLCPHQWHSRAKGFVGNVVFSYPRQTERYFEAMT